MYEKIMRSRPWREFGVTHAVAEHSLCAGPKGPGLGAG